MDEWATIEFSFQNVKRGVLRASRSAWAEELFSLIHFFLFFGRQDEYPLPRHFPISAPVQSQKRHQNLQKEYFELSTTQNKRIFTREITKITKNQEKRILWRKKNRENNEIIIITGDYPGFISRGKIIRPIIESHFLKMMRLGS